jgi:hypothetical protein
MGPALADAKMLFHKNGNGPQNFCQLFYSVSLSVTGGTSRSVSGNLELRQSYR